MISLTNANGLSEPLKSPYLRINLVTMYFVTDCVSALLLPLSVVTS